MIIDFDGIFNPLAQMEGEAVWPDMTNSSFIDTDGDINRIVFSPTVVDYFHSLAGRASIVWLTTWKENTPAISQALGLPTYPWLGELEDNYIIDSHNWWKTDVIKSLASKHSLLWIDDEIPTHAESPEQQLITQHEISWISPTTYIGLTPDHLDEIEVFVKNHPIPDSF